jgi:hypothetical protein
MRFTATLMFAVFLFISASQHPPSPVSLTWANRRVTDLWVRAYISSIRTSKVSSTRWVAVRSQQCASTIAAMLKLRVTAKDKTWRVLTYFSRNAETYLEFTHVIDVPFYLMYNCGFRDSAMLYLETIQIFRHALQFCLQGEFQAGGEIHQCVGLAVRVKVWWSWWLRERVWRKWWTQTSLSLYLYRRSKLRDVIISMASRMMRGDGMCGFCESFSFMFSVVISTLFYEFL